MCSTLRPARATVHDEARSVCVCYAPSAGPRRAGGFASLRDRRAPTECADGERRGRIRACTCLTAHWYLSRSPHISAASFGVFLHARVSLCGGRLRGAAPRYPSRFRTAAAPLTTSSAIELYTSIVVLSSRCAHSPMAKCSGVSLHGRQRDSVAPPADAEAETAHPLWQSWALTAALAAISNRTIRRLPKPAAQCSALQPLLRTAGQGEGGGPHRVPQPQTVSVNKPAAGGPEGRLRFGNR
jgi:hypothetical protein